MWKYLSNIPERIIIKIFFGSKAIITERQKQRKISPVICTGYVLIAVLQYMIRKISLGSLQLRIKSPFILRISILIFLNRSLNLTRYSFHITRHLLKATLR